MDDCTFEDLQSAKDWSSAVEKSQSRHADIYPLLKEWTERIGPAEILDIGCGQGICSEHLNLQRGRYTGVEPSPFLWARARELYPETNKEFLRGSAYALPVANATFDSAFSVSVWHLLGDLRKAAEELSRVLKPGGRFLIVTANPHGYSPWLDLYTDFTLDGQRFEGTLGQTRDVLFLYSLEEILTSLAGAGLTLQKEKTFRRAEKPLVDQYLALEGIRRG